MKKMFLFGGIVILLFAAIFIVTNMGEKQSTTEEQQDTTDYYTNTISLDDLRTNLKEGQDQTIYFYQTHCVHCQKVSPIIVPMAEDMGIDMKVMDLEKEPDAWDEFNIKGTPTIIRYEGGKEVSRIDGEQSKDTFEQWFTENHK